MMQLGDGVEGLKSLPAGEAALILSDLPSGATQAEFDTPPDFERLWPAVWDALKEGGAVIFMCSNLKFAAETLYSQREHFRHELIWHKSLATGHLNAKRSPLRAHEYILVFSKSAHHYSPQMIEGASPIHKARRRSHGENYGAMTAKSESRAGATDRYPTSVLEFSSVGTSSNLRTHPQQKPVNLLRWLVRSYSSVGDLIVDPYAGSGSTGVAAAMEGRRFCGWDLSPRFGA